jgi:hypothetical protein
MMTADENGPPNARDHQFSIDSDDESFDKVDKARKAIGEHNDTHEYASIRQADEQTHSNGVLRLSSVERTPTATPLERQEKKKEVVTWMSLPHKRQLAVLTAARLSEPLVQTSLQSYMFYQLKSFDKSLPDSVIASQAGIMQASFTVAQFLTAMMWGRIADSDRGGRKTVLLIGLFGTSKAASGLHSSNIKC